VVYSAKLRNELRLILLRFVDCRMKFGVYRLRPLVVVLKCADR
jgi:hypothetical protein